MKLRIRSGALKSPVKMSSFRRARIARSVGAGPAILSQHNHLACSGTRGQKTTILGRPEWGESHKSETSTGRFATVLSITDRRRERTFGTGAATLRICKVSASVKGVDKLRSGDQNGPQSAS